MGFKKKSEKITKLDKIGKNDFVSNKIYFFPKPSNNKKIIKNPLKSD